MYDRIVRTTELLSAAGDGKRGDAVRQLLASVEVLPLDRAAAEGAVTRNKNHFERVPGLNLVGAAEEGIS